MSEQQPEVNETHAEQVPEPVEAAERAADPATRLRPLPLAVAWAVAPAALMALAGVCMELKMDDALPSLLLFLGGLGGIPAVFIWSIWMVYPANWTGTAKVVAIFPIAVVVYFVNLALAFGACALIDPPFHIQ